MMTKEGVQIHKDDVGRIAAAIHHVEALGLQPPPREKDTVTPQRTGRGGGAAQPVILRSIPNEDGLLLRVERAVKHPDFAGDDDIENLGRWISLSEKQTMELPPPGPGGPDPDPVPPELIDMSTWMHTIGRDYKIFVWPEGVPTDKTTDILTAQRIGGDFHVRMDVRLLIRRVQDDARVGSCFPEGAFED